MKEVFRSPKGFIFSIRHFFISSLTIAFLLAYSLISSGEPNGSSVETTDSSFADSFFHFSLTDAIGTLASVILAGLGIYAVRKKFWRENLAEHFKKAYGTQLKSIQKVVKESDDLREQNYSTVEDKGKQLWNLNKDDLLRSLKEIEDIKSSEDSENILNHYAIMLEIYPRLVEEISELRELKSLSKTGKIIGNVTFTNEFTEDFPEQSQLDTSIRLKPEYIRDGYVSQFWIAGNPFYPNDSNTGRKVKKRSLHGDDNWWFLSISSPYWKYVESVRLTIEYVSYRLPDGNWVSVPEDFLLPDGSRLSDWENKLLHPLKFKKDGEDH